VSHPGEEYAFVIEGEVDLHTSLYTAVRLKAGDSIYFDSGMGHAYLAAGPCRVLSICSGPETHLLAAVGAAPLEEQSAQATSAVKKPRRRAG
jgi:quercetin dioxygenase-like cupin family protein